LSDTSSDTPKPQPEPEIDETLTDEDEYLQEDYALSPDFVRKVVEALDSGDKETVKRLVQPLHAADFADLLGLVRPQERRALVQVMGEDLDPQVLTELDQDVLDWVVEYLDPGVLARAVAEVDSDDAVYLIQDLDEDLQREVLDQVPEKERAAVELSLQYPEYTAGRLMQRDIITVPRFWTVGQVIDYLRDTDGLPDQFYEIFVVDPGQHPVGTVLTSTLLRHKRPMLVEEIMEEEQVLIPADTAQEEAAYIFQQYDLVSAAVVDADTRIVGMLTIDDIVDVIAEEAEEDVYALSGVNVDEGLSDTVVETTRARFPWLAVNLLTAIAASVVIGAFEGSIQEIVALAVLMPIVASMGGNAGTQSLTVAVRALATKDLTPTNTLRVVSREVAVGLANGIGFAVIMGAVAYFWFGNPWLAGVVGVAMVVNLLVAGLAGIGIPIMLDRMGADPALSSTVFVTTVTDVVGFLVFLGLATMILLG